MPKHVTYQDEFNEAGNKTKGGTNKRLAQEIGITAARHLFEEMKNVEMQGINFKWESGGETLKNAIGSSAFAYFRKTPTNIKELEGILEDSFEIEWQIQLENAKNNNITLPLREVTIQNKVNFAISNATVNPFFDKQGECIKKIGDNNELEWRTELLNILNIEEFKKDSVERFAKTMVEKFKMNPDEAAKLAKENEEKMNTKVDKFWGIFVDDTEALKKSQTKKNKM